MSPRVAPFADLRDVGALLQRAGFALPVTDVDRVVVRYDNAFALMQDLGAWARPMFWSSGGGRRPAAPRMLRMAQIYGERFADADGRIRATFDVIWLSGWAPHESQQKPLQAGIGEGESGGGGEGREARVIVSGRGALTRSSLPGLTRQSITLRMNPFED